MNFKAENFNIGKNLFIDLSASIRGLNGNAKNIVIRDIVFIGVNVKLFVMIFQ